MSGSPPRTPPPTTLRTVLFDRRTLAALILLAWLGTLGALVRRQQAARAAATLVEGGDVRLPPGGYFLAVARDGQPVGSLSAALDTIATGFRLTERLDAELPGGRRVLLTTLATLGRDLRLVAFRSVRSGSGVRLLLGGEPLDDGRLRLTLTRPRGGAPIVTLLESDEPRTLVLPSLLSLRLAFGAAPRPGDSLAFVLFDPLTRQRRPLEGRRAADSTLVVPDSAAYDSVTGTWSAAHLDTVRARRFDLTDARGGRAWRLWVDDEGWPVRAESADGWVLERSAFELVRAARRPPPMRPAGPGSPTPPR